MVVALLVATSSAAAHHPIRMNIYARPRERRPRAESRRDSPSTTRFNAASVPAPLRDVADEPPGAYDRGHEQHAPPDDQLGSRFPDRPRELLGQPPRTHARDRGACVPTRNSGGGCPQVSTASDARFRRPAVVRQEARLASTKRPRLAAGRMVRALRQAPASFRSQHCAYAEITTLVPWAVRGLLARRARSAARPSG